MTTLFTCQVQAEFPAGTGDCADPRPGAACPPVLASCFSRPGLRPEGTQGASLPLLPTPII